MEREIEKEAAHPTGIFREFLFYLYDEVKAKSLLLLWGTTSSLSFEVQAKSLVLPWGTTSSLSVEVQSKCLLVIRVDCTSII